VGTTEGGTADRGGGAATTTGAAMNGAAIAVMATATMAATLARTRVVTGASRRLLFSSQALCLAASFMAGRRDQSPSDQGSCATRRGRRALYPPSWTARSGHPYGGLHL